jgi:hypothetical protein
MATICVTNSITIQPGENFVLPPGAEIIGSTDVDSITSSCVDLTNVEEPELFIALVPTFNNSNGIGEFFESDSAAGDGQFVTGHSLNKVDTFYSFKGAPGDGYYGTALLLSQDLTNIPALNQLISVVPGIFAGNGYTTNNGSSANRLYIWQIKVLPSIGKNLEVLFGTDGENFLGEAIMPYRIKFYERSTIDPLITTLPPII